MNRLKEYLQEPAFHREVWAGAFAVALGFAIYNFVKWLIFR